MSNKQIGAYLAEQGIQRYMSLALKDEKEKFILNLVSVVNQNPSLASCENSTLLFGGLAVWDMGLSLAKSLGEAYLVAYKNKNTGITEAQLQIGYKGLIQLALRTNEYLKLNAVPIYKNQFISWNSIDEELLLNNVEGEGEIMGYCAYFKLKNGFSKKTFWGIKKVQEHARKYSKTYQYNPSKSIWSSNFDAMACKTVLKDILSKYGLKSVELQKAIEVDQSILKENEVIYVDNAPEQEIKVNTIEQLMPPKEEGEEE